MRIFVFLPLLVLLGMSLLAGAEASASEGTNRDSLIYCSERNISHMNPQRHPISSMASSISFAVYDRLLSIDPQTKATRSAVGTLERIYHNDTIYVFDIAKNISFHSNEFFTPTRKLNAEDVVFSFDRIINKDNPFYRPLEDFPYISHMDIVNNLISVRAVGPYKVEFRLKQPTNLLQSFLATDNSVILSKEYADTILKKNLPKETIDHYAIGTGPYTQYNFLRGRYVKLKRFPEYHGHRPEIRNLILTNSYRANKLLYKMFTGECHIISNPTASQMSFLQKVPKDFNLIRKNTLNGTFIIYNTKKPYLSTGALRRTLSSMFSLEDLNRSVFFDQGHYIVELFDEDPSNFLKIQKGNASASDRTTSEKDVERELLREADVKPLTYEKSDKFVNMFNEDIPDYAIPKKDLPEPGHELFAHELSRQEYIEAYETLKQQELEITIFQSNVISNTAHSKIAQFLKSNFEKKGLRARIKTYRTNQEQNRIKKGLFDLAIVNVYSDSESLIYQMISCRQNNRRRSSLSSNISYTGNYTGWCNDTVENMYEDLSYLDKNDPDAIRLQKYIMNILVNEMPVYPLIYNLNLFVAMEYVEGLEPTPYGGVSFINARIKHEGDKK